MLALILKGFLCLIGLFAFCTFTVIGIKITFLSLKAKFSSKGETVNAKAQTIKPQRKPINSISINPEEIDRIYVKKSS